MKVLWFINIPAGPEAYLGIKNYSGFWLSSLSEVLKEKVELNVAFYYRKKDENFNYQGINYFPMKYRNWYPMVIKNVLNISIIDDQDLVTYSEIILKVNPDIIHIHGTENPFSCLIGNSGVPIVVSIQGLMNVISQKWNAGIEEEYTGSYRNFLFKLMDLLTLKQLGIGLSSHHKMALRERRNLAGCRNIIGRTDWDKRVTKILAPGAKYFHNDEMIRTEFYKSQFIPGEHDFSVFSTSSGASYKGFELICLTLHELHSINIPVQWVVAGIAENDVIVKTVKRKLKNKFPLKGLKLLGKVSTDVLIDQIINSNVYVMPSHIENGCNALSEAMLLGMPCITTLAGGTGTTLKDKEEGIVIQSGDSLALAGAILELKENPVLAGTYGQAARRKALLRHDADRIISDLLKIYDTMLLNEV